RRRHPARTSRKPPKRSISILYSFTGGDSTVIVRSYPRKAAPSSQTLDLVGWKNLLPTSRARCGPTVRQGRVTLVLLESGTQRDRSSKGRRCAVLLLSPLVPGSMAAQSSQTQPCGKVEGLAPHF